PRSNSNLHSFPTRRSSDLELTLYRAWNLRFNVLGTYALPCSELTLYRAWNLRFNVLGTYASTCSVRASSPAGVISEVASRAAVRSEEHTSELQSPYDLVCR